MCFERHVHYLRIFVQLYVMLEIKPHVQFTGNKTGMVLAIVLPIVFIMAMVVLCYCLWRRKREPAGNVLLIGKLFHRLLLEESQNCVIYQYCTYI